MWGIFKNICCLEVEVRHRLYLVWIFRIDIVVSFMISTGFSYTNIKF